MNLRDARPVWTIPEWSLDAIHSAVPQDWDVVVVESDADGQGDGGGTSQEVLEAIRGAEVYLGYGFPPELLEAATSHPSRPLRWVHSGAAGVGSSLYPAMRESEIILTNSAGIHADPMAETVIAALLYFARGLDFALHGQVERRWNKPPFESVDTPVREISGASLGILGFGGIGRAVARRGNALGMRVRAWKRRPAEAPPGVELVFGDRGFTEILIESDYVVITLPETRDTRGLIGTAEMRQMRDDAVLVNVGRGALLDEAALHSVLSGGHLRGAALDVFATEPLPRESPLWGLPNVLITPHVSATTRGFWRRQTDLIVDNLRRYLTGERLRNVVDKAAGY